MEEWEKDGGNNMNDLQILAQSALFQGVDAVDISAMLNCLDVRRRYFRRGEMILCAGDLALEIGLVLEGGVRVERVDAWGNRSILERFGPGETFAEAYACVDGEPLLTDVVAATDCNVLFLDATRILTLCPSSCPHHIQLLRNLLTGMAAKNILLSRKMRLITPRTIRERLLAYLSGEAVRRGVYTFVIPFDRQQLADYLSVERSALSAELSKMRRDGLIECQKNRFTLLTREED